MKTRLKEGISWEGKTYLPHTDIEIPDELAIAIGQLDPKTKKPIPPGAEPAGTKGEPQEPAAK